MNSSDKLKVVMRDKEVWIADGTEAEGELGFFRVHGNWSSLFFFDLCFDDHGSFVIFRSASVRPKHLFD
jgi:hypothetical protein